MDFESMPIDAQLALFFPGWIILGLLFITVGACVAFACTTRKYVREIKENFPRLNFNINCILFVLMFLALIPQIATHLELGVRGYVGMGWLYFFVAKYFIARSIVLADSAHGYIHKTIFIYTMVFVALSVCGFMLGGLLWHCLSVLRYYWAYLWQY